MTRSTRQRISYTESSGRRSILVDGCIPLRAYKSAINENILLAERKKAVEAKVEELESAVEGLKRTIEIYRKALFGRKSEKVIPEASNCAQVKLFPTGLGERPEIEEEEGTQVKTHTRRKRKRYIDKEGKSTHFPPELKREDIVLEAEGDKKCKHCGKDKIKLSDKITEKLCEVPAKFYVKRLIRPVFGCNCGKCSPCNVALPKGALPKSYLDESFLASSFTKKFAWHLPFYRQHQMLRELGIDISRDVLIYSAIKAGKLLFPIVEEMLNSIKSQAIVQMDESPVVVGIKEKGLKKKYKQSYFWPILSGKEVVFNYAGNRKHCNVEKILGSDFKGILLSDGYQAYASYCKSNTETSLALCWDHARRRFYEIKDDEPLAVEALVEIGKLYKIEEKSKKLLSDNQLKPEKIPKYRKEHALPVLNEFKSWLETVIDAPEVLPKSKLMGACSYVLNHWNGLNLYLNHGFVPISNITVEQQIKSLKLGAKNWLFAASETGAETVSVFNSLICTCKMNDINCLEYLHDILTRIHSDDPKDLTPLNWQMYNNQ